MCVVLKFAMLWEKDNYRTMMRFLPIWSTSDLLTMAVTPEEWFQRMPLITKSYLVAAFATTTLITLGFLPAKYIYLDFKLIYNRFEVK